MSDEGINSEDINLFYQGTPLEDELTFEETEIENLSTIDLVLALKGGKKKKKKKTYTT